MKTKDLYEHIFCIDSSRKLYNYLYKILIDYFFIIHANQNILTIAEIHQLRLSDFMYLSFSGHRKLNFDFISHVSWHNAYNTRKMMISERIFAD
jgi:hypothetical protein